MNTLIIGGTSGLGLELAKIFVSEGKVIVTGRHDPNVENIDYKQFDLAANDKLASNISEFVGTLPNIDVFIYAAGFYQEGNITELSADDINNMMSVGINAPVWFVRDILSKQNELTEFIAITSTSQWTPREKEPVYNATKAALGHFSNALAEDGRISKVMVAGPAGMDTAFWREAGKKDANYNNPAWVAQQIIDNRKDAYKYKFIKILRDPPRVEVAEKR